MFGTNILFKEEDVDEQSRVACSSLEFSLRVFVRLGRVDSGGMRKGGVEEAVVSSIFFSASFISAILRKGSLFENRFTLWRLENFFWYLIRAIIHFDMEYLEGKVESRQRINAPRHIFWIDGEGDNIFSKSREWFRKQNGQR